MRELNSLLCSQCGAPLEGNRCAHCGTSYSTVPGSLLLVKVGNHPRLIRGVLQEMAECFYQPGDAGTSLRIAAALGVLKDSSSELLDPPLLLLELQDAETLTRWKLRIEENGGEARIES